MVSIRNGLRWTPQEGMLATDHMAELEGDHGELHVSISKVGRPEIGRADIMHGVLFRCGMAHAANTAHIAQESQHSGSNSIMTCLTLRYR